MEAIAKALADQDIDGTRGPDDQDLAAGRAVIATLRDAGFVIVPREPAREMWAAGGDAVMRRRRQHHDALVGAIWNDMLDMADPLSAEVPAHG